MSTSKISFTSPRLPRRCAGPYGFLRRIVYAEPTDIIHRNRRSHGAMYPMDGLHSRSWTPRPPRFIGSTETLLASLRGRLPRPPVRADGFTGAWSTIINCYSHSGGPGEPSGATSRAPGASGEASDGSDGTPGANPRSAGICSSRVNLSIQRLTLAGG